MKRDQIEHGKVGEQGKGLGTVTREMVARRAVEIALINGRSEKNVLDSDLEQASRELQGQETLTPEPGDAERRLEGDRWNFPAGSPGRKARTVRASDEQTVAEKLVEEGVADAEHDQQVEATRADLKRETGS